MVIANLPRYDIDRDYDCGQSCGLGLCEYSDGEWVKFEEAVEASSNSLQQLKAEICAEMREAVANMPNGFADGIRSLVIEWERKLSAV